MEFDKDFLRMKGEGEEIFGVIRPVLAGFVLSQTRSLSHTLLQHRATDGPPLPPYIVSDEVTYRFSYWNAVWVTNCHLHRLNGNSKLHFFFLS